MVEKKFSRRLSQMKAEEKISFEIICVISGNICENQREKPEKFPADYRR
jgi:hypothetical protein